MKRYEYTITDAVRETLTVFPKDCDFHFYEFVSACRRRLKVNGSHANPYDGSIQRIMRMFRKEFNLVCVSRNKSIYRLVYDERELERYVH